MMLTTLMFLVSIPALIIALLWSLDRHAPQPWLWLAAGASLVIIALAICLFAKKVEIFRTDRITEVGAWFKGAGEPFLQAIDY